jgi:hypothetical protein
MLSKAVGNITWGILGGFNREKAKMGFLIGKMGVLGVKNGILGCFNRENGGKLGVYRENGENGGFIGKMGFLMGKMGFL